jgi:hypothetical protein
LKARCAHLLRLHGESDCAVSQDSLNDGLKVSQAVSLQPFAIGGPFDVRMPKVASRSPTNIDARGSNHTNPQGDVHYNYSLVTIKFVGRFVGVIIIICKCKLTRMAICSDGNMMIV